MTEVQEQQGTQFESVKDFIEHLKSVGEASVPAAEVAAILEQIQSRPKPQRRRGQLANIPLEEMTLEQLKREKINASSVLYKAKQRGASEDTIARNQARVDAVVARLQEVQPKNEEADEEVYAGEVNEAVETEI